jgi:hypothetical protein
VAKQFDVHAAWFPVIGKALAYLCLEQAQNRTPGKFGSALKRVKFLRGLGLSRDDAADVAGSSAQSVRALDSRVKRRKAKNSPAEKKRRR